MAISNYRWYCPNVSLSSVLPTNRDALRFLWRFSMKSSIDTYKINVHLFGKTNSPYCLNWALRKTLYNQRQFNKMSPTQFWVCFIKRITKISSIIRNCKSNYYRRFNSFKTWRFPFSEVFFSNSRHMLMSLNNLLTL